MQMVASSKLRNAQAKLASAQVFGSSLQRPLSESAIAGGNGRHLLVLVTSDRGLCGAINSSIVKETKKVMRSEPAEKWDIVPIGLKSIGSLGRTNKNDFQYTVTELGKKPITFSEILQISEVVSSLDVEYDSVFLLYNHFNSVISYELKSLRFPSSQKFLAKTTNDMPFEVDDDEELADYYKFNLAGSLWNGIVQSQASELGARMSSMDNATRNANDIKSRMTTIYNRGRQAKITTELIEIISGAAAISG
jgi:ATP synthase F1 gamma subunit